MWEEEKMEKRKQDFLARDYSIFNKNKGLSVLKITLLVVLAGGIAGIMVAIFLMRGWSGL